MTTAEIDTPPDVMPSATPTEAEVAAWNTLPRDEQVRRMKAALSHPDCSKVGTASMSDIRERGQALAAKQRNG
jgi:hypothetical protein